VNSYISLQAVAENAFSDSDVRLLETLANSMSVALENARLFDETTRLLKETEQRTAELAVINSVQEGLAKELDLQGIYDLVGDRLCDLFPDTHTLVIRTFDIEKGIEHLKYAIEKGQRMDVAPRPYIWANKKLIETKRPLSISRDYLETAKKFGGKGVTSGQPPKSAVFVPMMVGDVVKGSISLQNMDREDAFTDADIRLLSTISNSMSVALENARLFDETSRLLKETEQRTAELAVINSVQEGLSKELDLQGIYNLVGDRVQKLFNAQAVIIATLELETDSEHFNYVFENNELVQLDSRPITRLRKILIEKKHTIYIGTEEQARKDYGIEAVGDTQMPKSLLFVPLLTGNHIKGYVSLQNMDIENAFSDSDIRLLETLANSMSVALENARLFDETNRLLKETEQRTAEFAVINSVQEGLAKELDTKGIYDLVGDRLCSLFPDSHALVIRTFDYETGLEHWQYAMEKWEKQYVDPRPFNWNSKLLMESKKTLEIKENYVEESKKHGGTGVTTGQPPKSAVFVPMLVGDVVKGSVSLQNIDKENAFTDSDVRLLTTITNSMSVALENARLFNETSLLLNESKQRTAELSTVNNISKALASLLDTDDLIRMVGDQLKDLFKANIVYLALYDELSRMIHFKYQFGEDMPSRLIGEGLTSKILMTGEPLLINNDLAEQTVQMGIQRMGIDAASYLGVPIPVGDIIGGVLSVQSTERENRFNENDLRLLTTIASSVGVALKNATLFEDVKNAQMEAEEASKAAELANEAKSAFLSTVSHELRTPLTSVLGFAKIIRKRLEEKIFPVVDRSDSKTEKAITQVVDNLQVVISEGERLTHLINDVLDLAKIEAGKMEWNQENVSVPEIVERAISATTSLFEHKPITLEKEIETPMPDIIGDRDKLIQVVINLISNAVKFTDKGTVTCTARLKDDNIIVSISDTGIGIAKEDYGAVFEQFKQVGGDTLTDKPKGTGLGLPICKEIVEHHGGSIWLESEQGKGSTFFFSLPLHPKSNTEKPVQLNHLVQQLKAHVAGTKADRDGQPAHILIVDDDESIRSLLHQELGEAGYQVSEAVNGIEALERVRANRPDLVVLDIMMPEMNGFDVAAILKNDPETMDIPILVLSVVQDKARGLRIGVDRYLTKPIDTGLLFNEIGHLLEHGTSRKKVLIANVHFSEEHPMKNLLYEKGYDVLEVNEPDIADRAKSFLPDIIMIHSELSAKRDFLESLRFEKGLENVFFVVYQ
jgi:signal transduction histidine kinase/DNA-binding NarL/FixJ family response regulator